MKQSVEHYWGISPPVLFSLIHPFFLISFPCSEDDLRTLCIVMENVTDGFERNLNLYVIGDYYFSLALLLLLHNA